MLLQLNHPELYVHSLDLEQLEEDDRLLSQSPDSMLVVTRAADGGDIEIRWAYDGRRSVRLPHDSRVYEAAVEGPPTGGLAEMRAFIEDAKRRRHALTAAEDDVVRLWSLPDIESLIVDMLDAKLPAAAPRDAGAREPKLLVEFDGHQSEVTHMAFSRNGRYAVTTSGSEVAVWHTGSGSEPLIVAGHRDDVTAAAFSPDSRRLVTADADGDVLIRDLKDLFAPPVTCDGKRPDLVSATFSPDGTIVLTLSSDGQVWKCSAADGTASKTAKADCEEALEIAFVDVDGNSSVACADGSARLFNVADGDEMHVLR